MGDFLLEVFSSRGLQHVGRRLNAWRLRPHAERRVPSPATHGLGNGTAADQPAGHGWRPMTLGTPTDPWIEKQVYDLYSG